VVESAGRILVGLRPAGVPLAGLSEFPGGKCEADETPRSCAVRECREETGLVDCSARTSGNRRAHLRTRGCGAAFLALRPESRIAGSGPCDVSVSLGYFEELATLEFPEANKTVLAQLLSE
jgi:8-oxo-dGTP pyrophosphatase MutT (NUDIX family)